MAAMGVNATIVVSFLFPSCSFDGPDQLVPFKMHAKYAPPASTTTTTTTAPPIVEAVPASVDQRSQLVTYERYCHVYRSV